VVLLWFPQRARDAELVWVVSGAQRAAGEPRRGAAGWACVV